VPVAKRNFSKRHSHGRRPPPRAGDVVEKKGKKPHWGTPSAMDAKQQADSCPEKSISNANTTTITTKLLESHNHATRLSRERADAWASLLDKRPSMVDQEAMRDWISQVLIVSDKSIEVNQDKIDGQSAELSSFWTRQRAVQFTKKRNVSSISEDTTSEHKTSGSESSSLDDSENASRSSSLSTTRASDTSRFAEWIERKRRKSSPGEEKMSCTTTDPR
jgi:hypothetical protein